MSIETSGQLMTVVHGGRTIAWASYGDRAGAPVIYFHGAGGSRLEAQILDDDARAAGLRIISVDRPGSGRTDPWPGRTLLDSVADLAPVLEAEGVATVAVSGLSAGAMYAWAAASRYRDQITGVVAISPSVPVDSPAVAAALSTQFKVTAFMSNRAPWLLTALLRRQGKAHQGPTGQAKTVKMFGRISPADADVLADPAVFEWFRTGAEEGRRQGSAGSGAAEFALMTSPWGFDPMLAPAPTTVVRGDRDPLASAHQAYLAQSPGIVRRELPSAGHIVIATPQGRAAVLAAMATYAPASR